MSEMIERVARAIAAADQEDYMEDCARYDARARAAVAEMREPTKAMVAAGEPIVYDCYSLEHGEGLDENPAVPTWEAMIDAALGHAQDETTRRGRA